MFGYISVNKPELKIKEYERYHAYYCGVCRDLRELYGLVGQATLSFDLTFLSIFLTALYEPKTTHERTACIVHPLSRHDMLRNEYTRYAAQMNIILAYQKALDDVRDEKSLKGKGSALLLEKAYRKTVNIYHEKALVCSRELRLIHALEKRNITDPDALAGCFGRIMGEMFVYREDEWASYLRRFGFYLGKFIYLYDAWDDVEKDIENGTFNPLKERYMKALDAMCVRQAHQEQPSVARRCTTKSKNRNCQPTRQRPAEFDAQMKQILTMMMSECAHIFETLPILREAGMLRNILYAGVWSKFASKTNGQKTNPEHSGQKHSNQSKYGS